MTLRSRSPRPARRTLAVLLAGSIGSTLAFVGVVAVLAGHPLSPVCGDAEILRIPGQDVACVHADEAPPGVDVTEHVATAELVARPGAGEAAYEAAQDLGVPAPAQASATSPSVTCDGDGSSGYRTQAMYVVEAGRTNRYAALLGSMQLWAAGTDDVFNRSAALTGGVRHLRYVTEAGGGGTCVAKVLNVTVPAGSTSSFNATISAVQALGYTNPARKYLMWTDASVLCGIASMYPYDSAAQSNPNNGSYAQYARVDSGCWGFGNGSNQHSVEAHELLHTLGGVQRSAPNSTAAGHCTDDADTMCYSDGAGVTMRQICPADREFFFDCNSNDYYSTYPDPGAYLSSHWNTADSQFLIGGGTGTTGGTAGAPTVLGASIAVNNPAVPGLPTQASVTPALPTGRTLASVVWSSKRKDCTFATPTAVQSSVTCDAATTTASTVTAVLTDSTGATKTVTSPLTFATGSARPVTLGLSVDGQDRAAAASASVCTGATFPLTSTVRDTATGQVVKGLKVGFTKQATGTVTTAAAGTGATSAAGVATASQSAKVGTAYTARTAATTVYAAGASSSMTAVPGTCTPALAAEVSSHAIWYGDPVTVSGRLTRTSGGATLPVGGAALGLKNTTVVGGVTKVAAVASIKTGADGTFSATVKPTASGRLSLVLPASAAYATVSADLGALTVTRPSSSVAAAVDRADGPVGSTVTVTGTLARTADDVAGVAGAAVTVTLTPPGRTAVVVGRGRTAADGTFRVAFVLRTSGTLAVTYAGSAGLPAATTTLGTVSATG